MPRGFTGLAEQLRRAPLSIPLDIAEGTGRTTGQDAARFYGIARGSAMECGALLDAIVAIAPQAGSSVAEAHGLVVRIVEMLTKMCRPT